MKRPNTSQRQGGFTLVEIAIVLMIVGLLIGGILRGQELIQSARVRNIIDQKSSIQTAYIGFMDRYRMLPGDLTATQVTVVGNGVVSPGASGGDGFVVWQESAVAFQNLTAAGFISCGQCMTVAASANPTINNSPINVNGGFLTFFNADSSNLGTGAWFDPSAAIINRLAISTGGALPSQLLAEVDRKADDGVASTGQLRFAPSITGTVARCAPNLITTPLAALWANPSYADCAATWLL